jgi:hypothetical protein
MLDATAWTPAALTARALLLQGYDKYVLGLYVICAMVLALAVLTIAVAVVLRKDDSSNVWIAR